MTGARGWTSVLLFVFVLVVVRETFVVVVGADEEKFEEGEGWRTCSEKVVSWAEAQTLKLASRPSQSAVERVKLGDLLFFLHVPRTGGRTFHHCFLKDLFDGDQLCQPSYANLIIDRTHPGCRLISTHGDYSFVENLQEDTASVITNIRQPLDRVLSTYEFSVEVAARSLRLPRARKRQTTETNRTPTLSNFNNRTKSAFALSSWSTVNIWPWKHLVPLMEKDLFARQDARLLLFNTTVVTGVSLEDSYDAAQIVMPFREFIHHEAAHELVHNGATFQVAGLTNTSFSECAREIRSCVIKFPLLGKHVLEVAKKRLDSMFYVGITGREDESATFLMKVLGDQISTEKVIKRILHSKRTEMSQKFFTGQPMPQTVQRYYTTNASLDGWDKLTEEEVIAKVLDSFDSCVADHRLGQQRRKSGSLQTIKPIKFSMELRNSIPDSVLAEVERLNVLDSELFAHAEVLFEEQQKLLEFGDFHFWKNRIMSSRNADTTQGSEDNVESIFSRELLEGIWHLIALWGLAILFILAVLVYTVTKRKSTRAKKT